MSTSGHTGYSDLQSSQELPLSDHAPGHFSQRPASYGQDGRKERRNPSITPRKFSRFFTPRSHGSLSLSSARQALHDITIPSNNLDRTQSSPLRPFRNVSGDENSPAAFTRDLKRRKLIHTPESAPEGTSKSYGATFAAIPDEGAKKVGHNVQSSPCARLAPRTGYNEDIECEDHPEPLKRIASVDERGLSGQLLQLRIGDHRMSRRQYVVYPVNDWQDETAGFHSRPTDVHVCTSGEGLDRCIPFCAVACNTNTLVAIGDEEGRVRLVESCESEKSTFKDIFLGFRVHTNAIIDMSFSLDDSLLATASGDQSARVVDMSTQTTVSILGNHSASLKQVRFQPGGNNNSILATSSRDGSVQIWDLRCKGSDGPVQHIHTLAESNGVITRSGVRKLEYGCAVGSINGAHRPSYRTRQAQLIVTPDAPSRGEAPGRIGDVSVTAIAFLPPGQEHLLLTASEADATVKLWDIRSLQKTRRRTAATPLTCTKQPQSHTQWRHFGISSLNINGDGTRLYTLCKDNTIYAYSTAHLILGQAPELLLSTQARRHPLRETQQGLGPIYGFRHPQLHATSFYVKSAVRKAKDGKSEVLAVGSSDGCAILFPTDERYLSIRSSEQQDPKINSSVPGLPMLRPALRRSSSLTALSGRVDDAIPISQNGTALVRGHDREVGSLTWTSDGELVTVGDDFLVRCWREGPGARDLRTGGEQEGRRWGCGWAVTSANYDVDDDD